MRVALILDAMGVLYRSADDVADLLLPFVFENGGSVSPDVVKREYMRASLGQISTAEFWRSVGVSESLEDDYIARHRLAPGLLNFLQAPPPQIDSIWCLSNDISEWSRKLRTRHQLAPYFRGFVVSGDVGSRKPDARIYQLLLDQVGRPARECVFVDDRIRNLDAAKLLGFRTVLFGESPDPHGSYSVAHSFGELAELLTRI